MDTLFIKQLRLNAKLGVLAWENSIKQPIMLNVTYSYNTKLACSSDEITQALDYTKIIETIKQVINSKQFKLIEHLAETIAQTLLSNFALINELTLELTKPHIIANTKAIGISIKRTRNNE